VISPVAGIVIGRMNLLLVHKGDALFHVAGFDDSVAVSESLDEFKEKISESMPSPTSGRYRCCRSTGVFHSNHHGDRLPGTGLPV